MDDLTCTRLENLATRLDSHGEVPTADSLLVWDDTNKRYVPSDLKTVGGATLLGSGDIDLGGGTITLPCAGSITALDVVRVAIDGKVYPPNYSQEQVVDTGSIGGLQTGRVAFLRYLPTTKEILAVALDSGYLSLFVGVVNQDRSLTWGSAINLYAETLTPEAPVAISYDETLNKLLVVLAKPSSPNTAVAIVVSRAASWVKQYETVLATGSSINRLRLASDGSYFYLLCREGTVNKIYKVSLGVSSASLAGSATFLGTHDTCDVVLRNATHVTLFAYDSLGTDVKAVDILTSTMSLGTITSAISLQPGSTRYRIFTNAPDKFWVAESGTTTVGVSAFSFDGTSVTNNSTFVPVYTGIGFSDFECSLLDSNTLIVSALNTPGTRATKVNISASPAAVLTEYPNAFTGHYVTNGVDSFGVGYYQGTGAPVVFCTCGLLDVSDFPYIGVAVGDSDVNTSTVSVACHGGRVVDSNLGLIPGQPYYVSASGTITGTTSDNLLGLAVAPDTLLITLPSALLSSKPSGTVLDNSIADPALIQTVGRYIVPPAGTVGEFMGNETKYADFNGTTFTYETPTNGTTVLITSGTNTGTTTTYTAGTGWSASTGVAVDIKTWSLSDAYKAGDIALYQNAWYQANGTIAKNTAFAVGTSGATWKAVGISSAIAESSETIINSSLAGAGVTTTSNTFCTFTLPTAGTWDITAVLRAGTASIANAYVVWAIYDAAGNQVTNTQTISGFFTTTTQQLTTTNTCRVTVGGSSSYTLRAWSSAGTVSIYSDVNGVSKVSCRKVAGFTSAQGQMTAYASLLKTSTQSVATAAQTITFDSVTGSMGLDAPINGNIVLRAGNTYELSGGVTTISGASSPRFAFRWYDVTNAQWLGQAQTMYSPNDAASNSGQSGFATAVVTPSANITVALRNGVGVASAIISTGDFSATTNVTAWATIKQIGTTSTAGFTGVIQNDWSIANSYPAGTCVVNNGTLYRANAFIPAGTAFLSGTQGTTWLPLQQAASASVMEYVSNYAIVGSNTALSGAATDYVDVPNGSITLPTAGTWEIYYEIPYVTSTGDWTNFRVVDSNSVEISGSVAVHAGTNGALGRVVKSFVYTNTSATTLRLQCRTYNTATLKVWGSSMSTSGANFECGIRAKKIGGSIPATGQTKDFGLFSRVGSSHVITTVPTNVVFNNTQQSNIPFDSVTGIVTLSPNKTYKLEAALLNDTTLAYMNYSFYNVTSGTLFGVKGSTESQTSTSNYSTQVVATAVITPSVTTQVCLRVIGKGANDARVWNDYSWMRVEEIGTTASSGFIGTIQPTWALGNGYDSGTIVNYGDSLYQANSLIPANTPFALGTSGATWRPLLASTNYASEFGSGTLGYNLAVTGTAEVTLCEVTVPSAGTWRLDYFANWVSTTPNTADSGEVYLVTQFGNRVDGSAVRLLADTNANDANTSAMSLFVTTQGAMKYYLKVSLLTATSGINFYGVTRINYEKIGGLIPVTGQTKSYLHLGLLNNQTISTVPSAVILPDLYGQGGDITYNAATGVITLPAGKVYKLEASLSHEGALGGTATYGNYQWFDSVSGAAIGCNGTVDSINQPSSFSSNPVANATLDTAAGVRYVVLKMHTKGTDPIIVRKNFSWLRIEEVGTTSTSGFVGSMQPTWSGANSYQSGVIVVKDAKLYQANASIPAGTPFSTGTTGATWLPLCVDTSGLSDKIVDLKGGYTSFVILTEKGKVYACGGRGEGQPGAGWMRYGYNNGSYDIGAGLTTPSFVVFYDQYTQQYETSTPVQIVVNGGSAYVRFANGNVWGWGRNDRGQLGVGDTTSYFAPRYITNNVVSIVQADEAGSQTSAYLHCTRLLVIKSDGWVYGCGENSHNQLTGNASANATAYYSTLTKLTWAGQNPINVIDTGNFAACVIIEQPAGLNANNVQLSKWLVSGWSKYASFGINSGASYYASSEILGSADVTSIFTGSATTTRRIKKWWRPQSYWDGTTRFFLDSTILWSQDAALSSNPDRIQTCGYNEWRACGDGTGTNRTVPYTVAISGAANFTIGQMQVLGGSPCTVHLLLGTDLWSWGYNSVGQTGLTTASAISAPTLVKTNVKNLLFNGKGYANYSRGYFNVLHYQTTDDVWWAVGCTNYGMAGTGQGDTASYTTATHRPMILPKGVTLTKATQASYGSNDCDTFATVDGVTGDIWAWGYNYAKLLGCDLDARALIPLRIKWQPVTY